MIYHIKGTVSKSIKRDPTFQKKKPELFIRKSLFYLPVLIAHISACPAWHILLGLSSEDLIAVM